jgi:hypothetical protein
MWQGWWIGRRLKCKETHFTAGRYANSDRALLHICMTGLMAEREGLFGWESAGCCTGKVCAGRCMLFCFVIVD